MATLFKALLAQTVGFAALYLLAGTGLLAGFHPIELASLQAVAAAFASAGLRSPRWWLLIHLCFAPSVVLALQLALSPWWYLGAFVSFALIYWSSFRTQVPLFLSNRHAVHRLARWLPAQGGLKVLDIGSGTGSMVARLARLRPDWQVQGVESAPAPYLLSRLRSRGQANVQLDRGDFWQVPLGDFDVVYAFLSPVPMNALWRKASREMRPGNWLVSNSFAVPGVTPDATLETGDVRGSQLFCYRLGTKPELAGKSPSDRGSATTAGAA